MRIRVQEARTPPAVGRLDRRDRMDPDEDLVGVQKMYKDYHEPAKALFHWSGNLEFDDNCLVSKGTDNGAYVAC